MARLDRPMSLRAYADRRGVTHPVVSKAVKMGRLKESIENGKIIDPELADQEWEQNTDYTDAPASVLAEHAPDMADASLAEKHWKAKLAELKFKQQAGELLEASKVEREWVDVLARVKTKLLGIPSRAKQLLPHLAIVDLDTLEGLLRETLEEIADDR